MEKYLNFPVLILSAFIIRPIYTGASIGDALVIIGFSGLYAVYTYLENKKQPVANKDLLDRVIFLEEQLKTTKETIHSIKLASTIKR
jgi:hypothetical protein